MLFCVGSDGYKGYLPFRCVCIMLLLAYLHVDVPLGFEALGALFTGSLHVLSTTGLTEVDTDPLHGVWKSIHKVTAIGTLLCR